MKKTILMICIVLSYGIATAQSNYQKGMMKGMEMLKLAKTFDDFVNVSNHFERIASVEKGEWLPVYWNAYVSLIGGMNAEKENQQDEMYDKALALLETIESASADQSELLTLKAYITLMKISVSPMTRAPQGTPTAMRLLAEAQKINPSNPRPFFVQGQNTFYTPTFFGGGKELAKPLLTKAVELYSLETSSEVFLPRWGKGRAEMLLKECN